MTSPSQRTGHHRLRCRLSAAAWRSFVVLTVFLAVAPAPAHAAAPVYRLTLTPGFDTAQINNPGNILVLSAAGWGLWRSGHVQSLPAGFEPWRLNDLNHIGGRFSATDGPAIWADSVARTPPGFPPNYGLDPYGFNDDDDIAGDIGLKNGRQVAFLWDAGVFHNLNPPGASDSIAWGVNNRRQVVVQNGSLTQTWLWQGGTFTPLPKGFQGLQIDGAGDIFGYTASAQNAYWHEGQVYPLPANFSFTQMRSATDGVGSKQVSGAMHAALYRSGTVYDLNRLVQNPVAGWTRRLSPPRRDLCYDLSHAQG